MITYGNETEDWTSCLPILKNAAGLAFDKELKSRLQDDVKQIKENHAEEQRVEELKKSVTTDYVYDVAISSKSSPEAQIARREEMARRIHGMAPPSKGGVLLDALLENRDRRDEGTLRASVPGVCTCCLGPPDGEQAVSHEWEETRGPKRYKRSVSFGFPICEACRNHQSEYSWKRILLVLLAAGISTVIAFFVAGTIQNLEWLPFVIGGGVLTVVLLFLLSAMIRLGVLPEQHACRGQAVEMRGASGSRAVFRFHNPIYADAFAKANGVTVHRHHECKPTRESFILVLPDAVLLVIAALVLGGIGQSIAYSMQDDGNRSSSNPPRTSVSRPPRTGSPPKRPAPTNRYTDSPPLKPPIYVPPQRYAPAPIDTGLSKKIDSGKARLRTMEAEITRMDSKIESTSAKLGGYKRELEEYQSKIRRRVRVDSNLYQRVLNGYNSLVKQYNSLLALRNQKFNEYQRELDSINDMVRRYNRGER
jgi:hypothetical protein